MQHKAANERIKRGEAKTAEATERIKHGEADIAKYEATLKYAVFKLMLILFDEVTDATQLVVDFLLKYFSSSEA